MVSKNKVRWANVQFVEFNKDRIFKKALKFLNEKNYKNIYFISHKKYLTRHNKIWDCLYEITKVYINKNKKNIFEYDLAYEFYYKHLATNIIVYYLLSELEIEEDLQQFIKKKIINEGHFRTPLIVYDHFISPEARESILTYYLALKWFYNEKTKKYYSEELLKEIKTYEESIKDSMDPNWRKKIEETGRKFKYRLRA